MILNYRVELCRECYYKRSRQCAKSDLYIRNLVPGASGGECPTFLPVSWLPIMD